MMMLSKEDLARIDRLELSQPNPDISWLCQAVRRLARIKPTEGEFSERLHVLNNANVAIQVRYAEAVLLEKQFDVPRARFEHLLDCPIADAFLCVRPYVRLDAPQHAAILDRMEREGRYTMLVEKDVVLSKGPLADILIGLDGYGVHRKPLMLRMPEKPSLNVMRCASDEDPFGTVQVAGVDLGVFLTTETKVVVELDLPPLSGPLQISIGLVIARYTTKGIVTPVSKG